MAKTKSYCYRLPWPPSINSYIKRGNNRSYMTKRGKEFRNEVVTACIAECLSSGEAQRQTMHGRLAVNIELTAPDRRKRDIDNHVKAVLDALQHVRVFKDDSQIDELRVKRLDVEAPGCCDVTICELPSDIGPQRAAPKSVAAINAQISQLKDELADLCGANDIPPLTPAAGEV